MKGPGDTHKVYHFVKTTGKKKKKVFTKKTQWCSMDV